MLTKNSSTLFRAARGTLAGVAALVALQGCSAGQEGGNYAEVRDNVQILDQAMLQGTSVESTRVLVPTARQSWVRDVQVGDVLVSDVIVSEFEYGLLRKVTAIGQEGEYTVLTTELAALDEVADEAEFHRTQPGDMFDPDRAELFTFGNIDINYDNTLLYQQDGLEVKISQGNLRFQPTLDFDFTLRSRRIETFQIIANGDVDANMVLTATAQAGFSGSRTFTKEIYRSQPKIFVHMLGLLPVVEVITATVDAKVELNAAVSGKAEVGVTAGAFVTAGVRLEEGSLKPVTDAGIELQPIGPTLQVNGQVTAKAIIEPRLQVALYGAAGASVGVQAFGEVAANATVDASVEGVEFAGSCGITLGVTSDVRAELPIFKLEGFNREIFRKDTMIDCSRLP